MAVSAMRNAQLYRYVENRHIDPIPAGARHGKPWHQFAFWFGSNVNVFNIVVGAVTVSLGLTCCPPSARSPPLARSQARGRWSSWPSP